MLVIYLLFVHTFTVDSFAAYSYNRAICSLEVLFQRSNVTVIRVLRIATVIRVLPSKCCLLP